MRRKIPKQNGAYFTMDMGRQPIFIAKQPQWPKLNAFSIASACHRGANALRHTRANKVGTYTLPLPRLDL